MKRIQHFLILSLFFLFNMAVAQQTIYNNFGEGHDGWDYNSGLGWTIAGDSIASQYGVEQAMGFESSLSGFVTDIWIAISYVPMSAYPDTVFFRLADNIGGLPPDPSGILEEWTLTGFSSWSQWNEPIHLVASNTTELLAGSNYWLWAAATDDTWTMWCMNENPALTCPHTLRREGENWLSISNETASAFRIDVSTGVGIGSKDMDLEPACLGQNYPNPFSGYTSIPYSVKKPDHIRLVVSNILGEEVRILTDGLMNAGEYQAGFHAEGLGEGIYFYSLWSGEKLLGVRKMNCVR